MDVIRSARTLQVALFTLAASYERLQFMRPSLMLATRSMCLPCEFLKAVSCGLVGCH
jgi:hypothetical protein